MRLFAGVAGFVYSVLGAVMLTQAAYDPQNVSASFVLLAFSLVGLGLYSGLQAIKKA